jgi:hypothetical protein
LKKDAKPWNIVTVKQIRMTNMLESVKYVEPFLRARHNQYYTYVEAPPPYLTHLFYGYGSASGYEQKNYNLTRHNDGQPFTPHEL